MVKRNIYEMVHHCFGARHVVASRVCMRTFKQLTLQFCIAVLFLSVALHSGTNVSASSSTSWLHTQGSMILDASGAVFMPKGAAVEELSFRGTLYGVDSPSMMIPELAQDGANMIRLAVNSYFWLNGNPADHTTSVQYQSTVDSVVQVAQTSGIYVMIDLHNTLQQPQNYNEAQVLADMQNPSGMQMFWRNVATHYTNRNNVVYSLLGQPLHSRSYFTAANRQLWWNLALNETGIIQGINVQALVFVPALDCCSLWQFFNNPLPAQNIVYANHRYYHWDIGSVAYANTYAAGNFATAFRYMRDFYIGIMFQLLTKGKPTFLIEFGANQADPNWAKQVTDLYVLMGQYGVGYTQWVWVEPPPTLIWGLHMPGTANLSPQGQLWVTGLTRVPRGL